MGHYDEARAQRRRRKRRQEAKRLKRNIEGCTDDLDLQQLRFVNKVLNNLSEYKTLDKFLSL